MQQNELNANCQVAVRPKLICRLSFRREAAKSSFAENLTRDKLEELTIDLVERTIKICHATVQEAGEEVEDVVLVGGMTRMPLVQQQ